MSDAPVRPTKALQWPRLLSPYAVLMCVQKRAKVAAAGGDPDEWLRWQHRMVHPTHQTCYSPVKQVSSDSEGADKAKKAKTREKRLLKVRCGEGAPRPATEAFS